MDNNHAPTPENPHLETVEADDTVTYRVPDPKLNPEANAATPPRPEAPQQAQQQNDQYPPQGQPGPQYQHGSAPQQPNPQHGGFPPPPPPRQHYQQAAPKVSMFKDGNPSVKTVVAFALSLVSLAGFFSRALALYNLIVAIVALIMVIGENKLNKTRLGDTTFIIAIVSIGLKLIWLVACVACLACVGCGSGAATDIFREFGNFR